MKVLYTLMTTFFPFSFLILTCQHCEQTIIIQKQNVQMKWTYQKQSHTISNSSAYLTRHIGFFFAVFPRTADKILMISLQVCTPMIYG